LPRYGKAHRPALILPFAKKFFRAVAGIVDPGGRDQIGATTRMRWTGQIFWLLAFGACAASHLLPAFTPEKNFQGLAQWEVVSSYSSATAPDSHGISCADPLFQARKELEPRSSGLRFQRQDYLITYQLLPSGRVCGAFL